VRKGWLSGTLTEVVVVRTLLLTEVVVGTLTEVVVVRTLLLTEVVVGTLTEVVVVRTPELNRTRELVLGLGLQFSVVRLTLGFVRSVQGSGNGLVGYKWVIVVVVRFGLGLR